MTKQIILKTDIKRQTGYLYFVGTDSRGCLTIGMAPMARGGKKKVKK